MFEVTTVDGAVARIDVESLERTERNRERREKGKKERHAKLSRTKKVSFH